MNNTLRIILGVLGGAAIGMAVNGGIISLTENLISPPAGVDPNDFESIRENIHLYEAKHYVIPFIAHALGTLIGAFAASKIAYNNKLTASLIVGIFFMLRGVAAVYMIGTPLLPAAVDLILAYIPMALLGRKLAR